MTYVCYRYCLTSQFLIRKALKKTQTALLETLQLCFIHHSSYHTISKVPITMICVLRRQRFQLATL